MAFDSESASKASVSRKADERLWCPFMTGQLIPKNCDRDKCRLWVVVRSPKDNRVVCSGCRFEIGTEAQIGSLFKRE